jgi:hypothetical protein
MFIRFAHTQPPGQQNYREKRGVPDPSETFIERRLPGFSFAAMTLSRFRFNVLTARVGVSLFGERRGFTLLDGVLRNHPLFLAAQLL